MCTSLLASVLAAGPSLDSDFVNTFWEQYSDQAIPATLLNNNSKQTIKLSGFVDDMLMVEMLLDDRLALIGMPPNNTVASQLSIPHLNVTSLRKIMQEKPLSNALQKLRSQVYPLINYHKLPISFTSIHRPNFMLLNALINSQQLEEASDLLCRISLREAPLQYSRICITLINAFIEVEAYADACALINELPMEGAYAANLDFIITATHRLRDAQQYESVIPLYQSIEDKLTDEQLQRVQLWLTYCLLKNGQQASAHSRLTQLKIDDYRATNFPLYKLVSGCYAYQEEKHIEALDHLSFGLVNSESSDKWIPEMLFNIGQCYFDTGNVKAARNVWLEISLLHEATPWFTHAENALNKLN